MALTNTAVQLVETQHQKSKWKVKQKFVQGMSWHVLKKGKLPLQESKILQNTCIYYRKK